VVGEVGVVRMECVRSITFFMFEMMVDETASG
jgi:hypothetical protein